MEISKEYIDNCKREIYQKTGRIDFSFWYEHEKNRRKKREIEVRIEKEIKGL